MLSKLKKKKKKLPLPVARDVGGKTEAVVSVPTAAHSSVCLHIWVCLFAHLGFVCFTFLFSWNYHQYFAVSSEVTCREKCDVVLLPTGTEGVCLMWQLHLR